MQLRNILAGIIAVAITAPAAAAVKIATFTGLLTDSVDYNGHFIAPGGSFEGLSYILTFTYDTTQGMRLTSPGVYDYLGGGLIEAAPVPGVVRAAITINGVTDYVSGLYSSFAYVAWPFNQFYAEDYSNDGITYSDSYLAHYDNEGTLPPLLDVNVAPTLLTTTLGGYELHRYTPGGDNNEDLSINFATDSLYSVRDAVPEPASWALMVAGFGLTGAALRQRRRVVA